MKKRLFVHSRKTSMIYGLLLFLNAPRLLIGEPTPAAASAFNSYSKAVESRLAQQHQSPNTFLAPAASDTEGVKMGLRQGELIIERLTPSTGANFSGSLLHHWRGTAFAPGAKAADFERLLRDFNSYPRHFSPQVLQAKVLTQGGDRMQAWMRVRQQHVITVVMDTTYDITFGQLDAQHRYSISKSTRIAEIDAAGTRAERTLSASEDHGFSMAVEHLLELQGAGRRTVPANRGRLAHSFHPARRRLGDSALRRQHSARIAGVHVAFCMQCASEITAVHLAAF